MGDRFLLPTLVVVGLVVIVLLIPPRFDPAIRWREWLERRRRP